MTSISLAALVWPNSPQDTRRKEISRTLSRRLDTSRRYHGDKDYYYFLGESDMSSTRIGRHGRGWVGRKKWNYNTVSVERGVMEIIDEAKFKSPQHLHKVKKRIKTLEEGNHGSYGKYRACGLEKYSTIRPRTPTLNGRAMIFQHGRCLRRSSRLQKVLIK